MMTTGLVHVVVVVLVHLNLCLSALGAQYFYNRQLDGLQQLRHNWTANRDGRGEDYLKGWGSETYPCLTATTNWLGVECLQVPFDFKYDGNNFDNTRDIVITVVGLTLKKASISGGLLESIGNLIPLMFLTVTGNPHLKGPLPRALGNLKESLITLDLHDNNFSGPFPNEVLSLSAFIHWI